MAQQNSSAPKPTTLTSLKKNREVVVLAPSGNYFKIKPLNMEQHALSGGLPPKLRQLALAGEKGMNEIFADDGALEESGNEIKDYLDGLVKKLVVEPDLANEDLAEVLLPADYRWMVSVAMGDTDRDGEDKLMWGREPLDRFQVFRTAHHCDDDCSDCQRVREAFSAAVQQMALAGTL